MAMSDKQMAMSPAIFSKFVMLRQSKLAIAALKEIYIDEAPRQHVSHDFTARLYTRSLPLGPPSHCPEPAVAADSESDSESS
jgi:hypothetical protein